MKAFSSFFQYILNARFMDRVSLQSLMSVVLSQNSHAFWGDDEPTYNDESNDLAKSIQLLMAEQDPNITVTRNYTDTEIPINSIAYHRIFGTILADDRYSWYFSTKQFMRDIQAAERNPQISAHFMHVSSGGGEAWLLDKAFNVVKNTKKPVVVLIEKCACSAAYYLSSAANKVYAYTQNDTIGSIGTMIYFWDIAPYYKELGFNEVEEYATKSTLKNKKFNELLEGKSDRYIKEELDPLQAQFESNVRNARKKLKDIDPEHPIFAGETYSGSLAAENGLIDGLKEIEEALAECYEMGKKFSNKKAAQNQVLNIYNS